jgi:short-subunit dehydrogenase
VRGITDSLFRELREFGIKVTGVYPGSTQTDFFNNSEGLKAHDNMLKPRDVAAQIVRAIETPDNFLVNEIVFRPLITKKPA